MLAKFKVKDILPNPFRRMDRYPIRSEKVAALRESLQATGFWSNVVARRTSNGKAEIAYGHHRLVALREEYGPNQEVDLLIQRLNDNAMLQVMARENMEEWGTSAQVEQETVRATVEAYAKGKIELPSVSAKAAKDRVRCAPSFIPMDDLCASTEHRYTAESLGKYLGWITKGGEPQRKVGYTILALQYIEEGLLEEKDFDGLSTKQAEAVVAQVYKERVAREAAAKTHEREAERAEREAKEAERREERATNPRSAAKARKEAGIARRRQLSAKKKSTEQRSQAKKGAARVGRAVSRELKSGKAGYREAAKVASRAGGSKKIPRVPKKLDDFARRLLKDVEAVFDPEHDKKMEKFAVVAEFRNDLSPPVRRDFVVVLERVAKRATAMAKLLKIRGDGKTRALTAGR